MPEQSVVQKLAAILAADVAGYTRLMADDDAATVAALDAARTLFREHVDAERGRIVDTAGDSVLAVFTTATGGVRAAIAIQESLAEAEEDVAEHRRMRFRIGVHLGEVIEKIDGTVYGDGVNLAARLEGLAAPGSICVSAAVLDQITGKLDAAFNDIGEHRVKNVARPIRAFAWSDGPAAPAASKSETSESHTKPTIAIHEFQVSGDNADVLAAGVVDGIATALTHQTGLAMVSETTGADYLVSGRIQTLGERYRATLRLVDSESGETFASDRFEGDLADPLKAEDDLTYRIYNAIRFAIHDRDADVANRKGGSEQGSQTVLAKAAKLMFQHHLSSYEQARELLDSIVAAEPKNYMALAMKAASHLAENYAGYRAISPEDQAAAITAAREAVRLNANSDFTHHILGRVYLTCERDFKAARREAERSLEINRYYSLSRLSLGEVLICTGQADEGSALCIQAAEANLRGAGNHSAMQLVALGELVAERYEAAIDWATRSDQRQADVARTLLILVAAAALGGDGETSRLSAERMLACYPEFRIRDFGNWPFQDPETRERLVEGLRLAGLPN